MRNQPLLETQCGHVVFIIVQHFLELAVAVAAEQVQRGGIVAAYLQPHGHAIALQGGGFSRFQQAVAKPAPGELGMDGDRVEPGHGRALREQQQHVATDAVGVLLHQGDGVAATEQVAETAARQPVGAKALLFNNQQGRKIIQGGKTQHWGVEGVRNGAGQARKKSGHTAWRRRSRSAQDAGR